MRMIPVYYYFHSINVILFTQQIVTELLLCALFLNRDQGRGPVLIELSLRWRSQ